jgi:putative SOS response-associated peptidase YedK
VKARWGLLPALGGDAARGAPLINARAESAAVKPTFREAFRRRRCLIPADGFYEWKTEGRIRQPFVFRLRDARPFAFAALWEPPPSPDTAAPSDSCVILTTDPNDLLREIHDRMPVILRPDDYVQWLDPAQADARTLQPLLRPYPADEMTGQRVGRRVNDARFDGPECLEPEPSLPFD